jgi:hypothetical protein
MLRAWEAGDPSLRSAIQRVDNAVDVGLHALGFRRNVRDVVIDDFGIGEAGYKHPDCTIHLAGNRLHEALVRERRPDKVFARWLHESLHGRLPFAPSAHEEYVSHRGYEEGLVEGLERLIAGGKAGMILYEEDYTFYLAAYRALATAFDLDLEPLWRALWRYAPGAIRAAFADTVDASQRELGRGALSEVQRRRIEAVADQVFDSRRWNWRPDEAMLVATWRIARR